MQNKTCKMRKYIKLLFAAVIIAIFCSSCEKGCICRNIDTGASEELYGLYSNKECEAYTEYYQILYHVDNVDCSMEWRK